MRGRVLALWLLGTSLLKTLLLRWLPRPPALRAFEQKYGREGLLAVSLEEHALLTLRYRCSACGKCDSGEQERIAQGTNGYRGLMATVLGGSRSLADYDAVSASLEHVPDSALEAGERACPEGVPIVKLVGLIRAHGERQRLAHGGEDFTRRSAGATE